MRKILSTLAVASLLPFAVACASDGSSGASGSAANGTTSRAPGAGATASAGSAGGASTPSASGAGSNTSASGGTGSGLQIPSLVNVSLRNVLNDLSVKLNIDRANVPVTIQLPVQLAANVCGVSVNVLAVSTGGQANCTAKSAPQELTQAVQQQMAAGGSVGGGAQSSTAAAGATSGSGAATGGAGNTSANSSGATDSTATPPRR